MTAAGLTTQYELDNGRALSADAAGNATYYLYGLGPIGELTDAWNYSLPDGSNTPRQLTNIDGEVTFAASYTPWGDTLETYGSGRFTQGYFGGIMDAATGLIYVGNGQYYDPATGRFLTRDARPNQNNPYTPIDPTGAMLGPLALLALAYGRKKSRGKWDMLAILLVLSLSLGVALAACGKPGTPAPEIVKATATLTRTATKVQLEDGEGNVLGTYQAPTGSPSGTPTRLSKNPLGEKPS
jgi:RHS repeat-associated protein